MSILGKIMDYQDKASKNITRIRRGTVVEVRPSGGVIFDTTTGKETGIAYKVKIQPLNPAQKAFWTKGMPDRDGSLAADCKQEERAP